MGIEENKALVRRYFEDAPDNPAAYEEIFAPKVLWHALYHTEHPDYGSTPQLERRAYEQHKRIWGRWIETISTLFAEDDRVMVHWVGQGRQQAAYFGIPPTNKLVRFSGLYIFRIANGKIVEIWNLWDRAGEWQQLGILPPTRELIARARERMLAEE